MKRLKSLTPQGYTLIELLLYMVIVGSLLLGATAFFALAAGARVKNQSIVEVDQQGVYLMEYLTQTIRNASSITTPAAASSGSTLTLGVPTASLSPTTFALSGTTLQVTEGSNGAVSLTNNTVNVSNLTFTNLTRSGTNGVIRVSFTLARVNTIGTNDYDYTKTFTTSAALLW